MNRRFLVTMFAIFGIIISFYANAQSKGEYLFQGDGVTPLMTGQSTHDHLFVRGSYEVMGGNQNFDNIISFKSGNIQKVWFHLNDDEIYTNSMVQALTPIAYNAAGDLYNEITYNAFQCDIYVPQGIDIIFVEDDNGEITFEQGDRMPYTTNLVWAKKNITKEIDGITYEVYTIVSYNREDYGCHLSGKNAKSYRNYGALKKDATLFALYFKNDGIVDQTSDVIIANQYFFIKESSIAQWDNNQATFFYGTGGNNVSQSFSLYNRVAVYGSNGFYSDVFNVNGIYYYATSSNTVAVTYRDENYNSYSGTITIPNTINYNGKTFKVTSIGYNAFRNSSGLTRVTIPNNVTSICDNAFQGCTNLKTLDFNAVSCADFSSDMTSGPFYNLNISTINIGSNVERIPAYFAYGLSKLISLTIGNSVTEIGDKAFYACTALTTLNYNAQSCADFSSSNMPFNNLNISTLNIGSSVQRIPAYLAYGLTKMTNLTIGNSVTEIGRYSFYQCTGLNKIQIGESVSTIEENAFSGCNPTHLIWNAKSCSSNGKLWRSNIEYATIGSSVELLPDNFLSSSKIKTIEIPNSVKSIGNYAFFSCDSLSKVNITDIAAWCSIDFVSASANPLSCAHRLYLNNNEVTELNIPNNVTTINDYAFYGCSSITKANLGNSVNTIGDAAFRSCIGLTNMIIPNSVTSLGAASFYGCTGLISVKISSSIKEIPTLAFERCSALNDVYIPESVLIIGNRAFRDCSGLTEITIPNSVTTIDYEAFLNCTGFTSVSIPNSVTLIGDHAFYACTSLKELNIDNGEEQLVMKDYSFANCPINTLRLGRNLSYNDGYSPFQGMASLREITISNAVTTLGKDAFKNCSDLFHLIIEGGLSQLTMPNNNNPFSGCPITLLDIGRNILYNGNYSPFKGMTSIRNLSIGDKVTSIGRYAFYGCSGFSDISIPNSVKTIEEYAFNGCNGVSWVSIGKSINSIGDYAFQGCSNVFGLTWNAKNCQSTGHLPADKVTLVEIGDEVEVLPSGFVANSKITEVSIPNSVTSILSNAFSNCNLLTSVVIPNSVTTINLSAFKDCSSMNDLTIGNGVTFIGKDAFRNCTSLTAVTIPSNVATVDYSAFCYCTNLKEVTIENGKEQMTMSTGSQYIPIFEDCPLETLYLGRDIIYDGSSPFYQMTTLKMLTIGNSVNSIGICAFYGCSKLSNITIPNSVKTVGEQAFYNCTNLTSATIGNSVNTLERYTFYGCSNLKRVIIGKSVVSINECVFGNCKNLTQVYCRAMMPPKYEAELDRYPLFEDIVYQNAILYVPDLTYAYYLQTEPWKRFMEIKTESYSDDDISFSTSVYPTSIRMEAVKIDGTQLANDYFTFEGVKCNPLVVTGLEPTSIYSGIYTMKTATETVETPFKFYTSELKMVPEGAKMLDATTALLKAETNMADEEMMCGFDWRLYEGPEDYLGTRVYCPVYDGTMAGTLKGLKKDTHYKYRPFYKSRANNVYYGDWVTFYTGDVGVEFDPVVYTYNSPEVTQTSAVLQGVALRGSDEITEQGFEYWRKNGAVSKVTATGERMSASVSGLQAGTAYTFRAYLKAGGKTAYGANVDFVTVAGGLDVNADGVVNIADINVIINYILTGGQNSRGDVNGDGVVNIGDVNLIINYILGH